jgi:hypothetical protein
MHRTVRTARTPIELRSCETHAVRGRRVGVVAVAVAMLMGSSHGKIGVARSKDLERWEVPPS